MKKVQWWRAKEDSRRKRWYRDWWTTKADNTGWHIIMIFLKNHVCILDQRVAKKRPSVRKKARKNRATMATTMDKCWCWWLGRTWHIRGGIVWGLWWRTAVTERAMFAEARTKRTSVYVLTASALSVYLEEEGASIACNRISKEKQNCKKKDKQSQKTMNRSSKNAREESKKTSLPHCMHGE